MRYLMLCLVLVLGSAIPAQALTLHQDDLVGLESSLGIVRIDGTTGAQQVISADTSAKDVAVSYGGGTIYTVDGSTLKSLDPATGVQQVVASGFSDATGVAVSRSGEVFVLDGSPIGGAAGQPRLYRVDVGGGGAPELVLESALTGARGVDVVPWGALDLEAARDDYMVALGVGQPFGLSTSNGVVGFDLQLDTEKILFDEGSVSQGGITVMVLETSLGVGAMGEVIVAGNGDYATPSFVYDFDTAMAQDVGSMWHLYDDLGNPLGPFYGLADVTETSSGRTFVAGTWGFL